MIVSFLIPNTRYRKYTKEAASNLTGEDIPLSLDDKRMGVGHVIDAKATKKGIEVTLDTDDAAIPSKLKKILEAYDYISVDPDIIGR